jgi:hypothetical protein
MKETVDFVRNTGFAAGKKVTEHAFFHGTNIKLQLSRIIAAQSLIVYI